MIGKLTRENYILKKEKEYIYYRSLFKSLREGCRLMGIKRSTFYYQPKLIKREKKQLLKIG